LHRVVLIQRSRGYAQRPTLTTELIGRAIGMLKAQRPDIIVMVDNCYGEFTETREPTASGGPPLPPAHTPPRALRSCS
jgi:cystathionine beta-lyase family protein involved in aluminum resistance